MNLYKTAAKQLQETERFEYNRFQISLSNKYETRLNYLNYRRLTTSTGHQAFIFTKIQRNR